MSPGRPDLPALSPPSPTHATAPAAAVVATGVVDLRRAPDATSELVSQLLFGEPLAVLGVSSDQRFLDVRGPDGYRGWARSLGLATGDLAAVAAWTRAADLRVRRPWLWRIDGGGPLPRLARLAPGDAGELHGPLGPVELRPAERRDVVAATAPPTRRPSPRAWTVAVRSWLGVPYLWGGRTPAGVDCSGLTQLVALGLGLELPRDARDQCAGVGGVGALAAIPGGPPLRRDPAARRPRARAPRVGDLLFFGPRPDHVTHVAISSGGLGVWHAYGWVRAGSLDPADPAYEPELGENFLGSAPQVPSAQ